MKVFKSRARSALMMICVVLAGLRFEALAWLLPLMAWAFALLGTFEIYTLGTRKGIRSSLPLLMAAATAYVAAGLCGHSCFPALALPVTAAVLVCAFLFQMIEKGSEDAFRTVPFLFFAPIYVGLPLACGLQILQLDRLYFLFLLVAIWSLDSFAYYVGSAIGRHKMAPGLSPKKSWEGAIAGLVGCIAAGLLMRALLPLDLGWGEVVWLGALFGIFGQLGDFAESALKRDVGVKDSGNTLTGHGGLLDRIDSLLFCFLAFYVHLLLSGGFEDL
jgi:phosphatidate cytidylyltransferase